MMRCCPLAYCCTIESFVRMTRSKAAGFNIRDVEGSLNGALVPAGVLSYDRVVCANDSAKGF